MTSDLPSGPTARTFPCVATAIVAVALLHFLHNRSLSAVVADVAVMTKLRNQPPDCAKLFYSILFTTY